MRTPQGASYSLPVPRVQPYLRARLLRQFLLRRPMASPARGIALSVLVIACVCAGPDAAAQFIPNRTSDVGSLSTRLPSRTGLNAGDGVALSGPVDANVYRLGPGDVFVVSIGGSVPRQSTTTVSADGLLVVPEAGTFQAAGRTLAAVRAEARAALRQQFRNVPADIVLDRPRRFSVYVAGAVPLPGRYALPGTSRVEDALIEAMGEVSPLELAEYGIAPRFEVERRAALRNVVVTARDGSETRVDLFRYYATGDLAFNPLLTDGASVYVPTFDPLREGVTVSGAVDRPGYYDWRPGDTAAALVAVAAGTGIERRAATVRRTRSVGGRTESVEVSIAEAGSLPIEPRDQVFVVPVAPEAGFAAVIGAVRYPGVYPIRSGGTSLRELVDAAGGLDPDALVRGAYVERPYRPEPEATLGPFASLSDRPLTTAVFDSTVTSLGQLSELGLVGRRYYLQEYASTPRLSLDVPDALRGDSQIILRDGDRLVVPRDLGLIRVFGQVNAPGYLPFEPGRTAGDYIERAGGPGPAATDVFTVDARTGRFIEGAGAPVSAGDAVFVDRPPTSDSPAVENLAIQQENLRFQEDRAEREAARDRRQLLIQAVTTGVIALGTLVQSYFLIRQNTQ